MRRCHWCVLVVGAVVVACGGSSSAPPPAAQSGPAAGGCGLQVFKTPACQAALDSVCCPLEVECAKDAACVALIQCTDACKASSSGQSEDTCANGCGMRARFAYCETTCRGKGSDCPTICAQKGGPAEPLVKWGLIAQCSKGVRYPEGARCSDRS